MRLTLNYELRLPASWPSSKVDERLLALRERVLTRNFDRRFEHLEMGEEE